MASLRLNDGIRADLMPWLGSLVVSREHRHQKIGQELIAVVKTKSLELGFKYLYLLAFDPTIPAWYAKLDCKSIGMDTYLGHTVAVMQLALIQNSNYL